MMRTLRRGVAVLTIAEAGLLLVLGVAPLLLLERARLKKRARSG